MVINVKYLIPHKCSYSNLLDMSLFSVWLVVFCKRFINIVWFLLYWDLIVNYSYNIYKYLMTVRKRTNSHRTKLQVTWFTTGKHSIFIVHGAKVQIHVPYAMYATYLNLMCSLLSFLILMYKSLYYNCLKLFRHIYYIININIFNIRNSAPLHSMNFLHHIITISTMEKVRFKIWNISTWEQFSVLIEKTMIFVTLIYVNFIWINVIQILEKNKQRIV